MFWVVFGWLVWRIVGLYGEVWLFEVVDVVYECVG